MTARYLAVTAGEVAGDIAVIVRVLALRYLAATQGVTARYPTVTPCGDREVPTVTPAMTARYLAVASWGSGGGGLGGGEGSER
jgi:hypothetical protein